MFQLIESFKKKLDAYATSPASNAAYAMSFLTIFVTVPLLALVVYAATVFKPLGLFAASFKEVIFNNFAPSTEADLMPVIEGFLSNAGHLGFIGAAFGLYSAYLFFSALDYWAQTIYNTQRRTDLKMAIVSLSVIIVIAVTQTAFSFLKLNGYYDFITNEILNLLSLFIVLSYVLIVLPNDTVRFKIGFSVAFILSVVMTITKAGFVYYAAYAFSYKTIYGSFATVMFLLIWIQICWWLFFLALNAISVHKRNGFCVRVKKRKKGS